jgi:2-isopropylmalate synthase
MTVHSPYFDVCGYKVTSERMHGTRSSVQAIVEVRIANSCVRRSGDGVGPVHALDRALRNCLVKLFPEVEDVRLSDYAVSVVGAQPGTGAQVRVVIQATNGAESWTAECTSANIIDASFDALCTMMVMGIVRSRTARASA